MQALSAVRDALNAAAKQAPGICFMTDSEVRRSETHSTSASFHIRLQRRDPMRPRMASCFTAVTRAGTHGATPSRVFEAMTISM